MKSANHVVTNAALSASFNSDPINMVGFANCAVQITVTGSSTLNGSFQLQGTCDTVTVDPNGLPANYVGLNNWSTITGATATFTADGSQLIEIPNFSGTYIRAVYTSTTGTATNVTIRANCKSDA